MVQPRIPFATDDDEAIHRETERIRARQQLEQVAQQVGGPGTRVADPNLFQRFLATAGEQYTRANQAAQSFLPSNQEIVGELGEIGRGLLRSPIPEAFVERAPSILQPAARVIRESAAPVAAATLPLGGSARIVAGGLLGAAGGATAGQAVGGDTGELIGAIGGGVAGGIPAVQRLAGRGATAAGRGAVRAGDEAALRLQGRQVAHAATGRTRLPQSSVEVAFARTRAAEAAQLGQPPSNITDVALSTAAAVRPAAVFGERPVQFGLTKQQLLTNTLRRTIGRPFGAAEDHPIATPIMQERSRIIQAADNVAAVEAARIGEGVRTTFPTDANGTIPSLAGIDAGLPGAPTIADVAARLPVYAPHLTGGQLQILRDIQNSLAPYAEALRGAGLEIGSRSDVIEGGFYIPRLTLREQSVIAPITLGRRAVGGKAGFERTERFASQAEAIAKGERYAPAEDAIRTYIEDAGQRTADLRAEAYFKNLIDPTSGAPVMQSAADRVNPGLRAQVEGLRAKITTRIQTLLRQETRARAQEQAATESRRVVGDIQRITGGNDPIADTLDAVADDLLRSEGRAENALARAEIRKDLMDLFRAYRKDVAGRPAPISPILDTERALARSRKELQVYERVIRRLSKGTERAIEVRAKEVGRVTDVAARAATVASVRASTTQSRRIRTMLDLARLRDELIDLDGAWKLAKEEAAKTPEGQGKIGLSGLQAFTFPVEMANAANKVLRLETAPTGVGSQFIRVADAVNRMYSMFRATLDNSALGIQGLLGLGDDPKAYGSALRVNGKAWLRDGDRVIARFVVDFDQRAIEQSTLRARDWASARLYFGGVDPLTEFSGLWRLRKAPGIRQANRAFGAFGDSLRLEWAEDWLQQEMRRTGKAADELLRDGTAERIAEAVNGMTGYSPRRFAGDAGQILLFAPRFLQARVETLIRGIGGLRPGATIEQRAARRSLLKLVGGAALMTEAANRALGQETDWQPILDGKWNSNFMKIRWGGRDWSLLGPYDSLARLIVSASLGSPEEVLRSGGSGSLQILGELVFDRWKTPFEKAQALAQTFVPFAAEELPFAGQQALQGEIGPALATLTGEAVGAKSSPISDADRRDATARQLYGRRYSELTQAQKARVGRSINSQARERPGALFPAASQ